jgi:lipopolysaccharide/colanic/teichoic acid biosynthesis glycosyltransferase
MTRLIDLLASGLGLIVLSPIFLAVALVIKLTSPGPVFYGARRVGKDGAEFKLYKFRSMVADADRHGPAITAAADSRITPIGARLRQSKLDELPQLINVIRGEMSLVGPRPEDPRYVAYYSPVQRQVLRVPPGITSPASLQFRGESSLLTGKDWEQVYRQQLMPRKLEIELEYLAHRNTLTDLGVILKTLWSVLARI